MNVETAAGVLLIVAPLWFNVMFALLGKRSTTPPSFAGPPRTSSLGSAPGDRR